MKMIIPCFMAFLLCLASPLYATTTVEGCSSGKIEWHLWNESEVSSQFTCDGSSWSNSIQPDNGSHSDGSCCDDYRVSAHRWAGAHWDYTFTSSDVPNDSLGRYCVKAEIRVRGGRYSAFAEASCTRYHPTR